MKRKRKIEKNRLYHVSRDVEWEEHSKKGQEMGGGGHVFVTDELPLHELIKKLVDMLNSGYEED